MRSRTFDIFGPRIDFTTRNCVPSLHFPISEIDLHQSRVGVNRKIEMRGQLLSQRNASGQRAAVDPCQAVGQCGRQRAEASLVKGSSRNIRLAVADSRSEFGLAVPQQDQSHAIKPR